MTDNQYWLTAIERKMLNKYLNFYRSLDQGIISPKTPAQKHFVLVCRGQARQQTVHEVVYMKYRRMEEAKQSLDRRKKAKPKKQRHHKSGTNKKGFLIDKKSERENISRILSRQKNISNAMVTYSD